MPFDNLSAATDESIIASLALNSYFECVRTALGLLRTARWARSSERPPGFFRRSTFSGNTERRAAPCLPESLRTARTPSDIQASLLLRFPGCAAHPWAGDSWPAKASDETSPASGERRLTHWSPHPRCPS